MCIRDSAPVRSLPDAADAAPHAVDTLAIALTQRADPGVWRMRMNHGIHRIHGREIGVSLSVWFVYSVVKHPKQVRESSRSGNPSKEDLMLRSRWLLSLAILFLLLLLALTALAATPTPALAEPAAPGAPAPWLTSLPAGRPLSGPLPLPLSLIHISEPTRPY